MNLTSDPHAWLSVLRRAQERSRVLAARRWSSACAADRVATARGACNVSSARDARTLGDDRRGYARRTHRRQCNFRRYGVPDGIRKYVEAEVGRDSAKTTSLVAPADGVTAPPLSGTAGHRCPLLTLMDFPFSLRSFSRPDLARAVQDQSWGRCHRHSTDEVGENAQTIIHRERSYTFDELQHAATAYSKKIRRRFFGLSWLVPGLNIWVTDLNMAVGFHLHRRLKALPEGGLRHIIAHSESLIKCWGKTYGTDSFVIGAHFDMGDDPVPLKWQILFGLLIENRLDAFSMMKMLDGPQVRGSCGTGEKKFGRF
jgi:hypothetical protein